MLKAVRWDRAVVDRFIGCMLSEPKPNVFLDAPSNPLSRPEFARRVRHPAQGGVRLDRRSRMLYDSTHVYLNGAPLATLGEHPCLASLADRRLLPPDAPLAAATLRLIHEAYLSGALHAGANRES